MTTWDELVELEPTLGELEAEARAHRAARRVPECANAIWYGYDGNTSMKSRLVALVGWSRRHGEYDLAPATTGVQTLTELMAGSEAADRRRARIRAEEERNGLGVLWTSGAYDIAYHHVYDLLPFCRSCGCVLTTSPTRQSPEGTVEP